MNNTRHCTALRLSILYVKAHPLSDPYPPNPSRLPMILLLLLLVHISGYPMPQICERLLLILLRFFGYSTAASLPLRNTAPTSTLALNHHLVAINLIWKNTVTVYCVNKGTLSTSSSFRRRILHNTTKETNQPLLNQSSHMHVGVIFKVSHSIIIVAHKHDNAHYSPIPLHFQ